MFSKILVPLDGSDLAEAILPYATEVAKKFGAQLTLLQVVDPLEKIVAEMMPATIEPTAGVAMAGLDIAEEQVQAEHEIANRYLSGVQTRLHGEGLAVRFEVIEGNAKEDIVRYANEQGIDLIAMSTHGRTGLLHLVRGSVTEAVLHSAICPVLVIRSQSYHKKGG